MKKYKLGLATTYMLNVFVTGMTEYICALALVIVFGHNAFWNYNNEPFNLQGYTCLFASMIFGVMATLFLYFVYPACERLLARLTRRQFWVLVVLLSELYFIGLALSKRW